MISRHAAIAIPEIVPKESWELEFGLKRTIPGSGRTDPAKALLLFSEILNLGSPMKVLDAGCGNGRNTVYLANRGCKVTSVDFAEVPISMTKQRIDAAGLQGMVTVLSHSLVEPVPFAEDTFDFVLDSYVSCHFLSFGILSRFWQDMARVTKQDGHLLSVAFSVEDEYYAKLMKTSPSDSLICDPVNGIWKRLYTEDEIKSFFSQWFKIEYFNKFEFSDVVLGTSYRRVVLTSVLKKA
jgi:ubiquinone/menaquinone biosynthesis C-methylase UbiE